MCPISGSESEEEQMETGSVSGLGLGDEIKGKGRKVDKI